MVKSTPPFLEAFGAGHPSFNVGLGPKDMAAVGRRLLLGGQGVPHAALLARPVLG